MRGEPGTLQMKAWRAFLAAHARITAELERDLVNERDLPLSWYDVLYTLSREPGAMRMSDLSRAVLLSKSGLTRLVDKLCAAGYVSRCADPADRRGVQVSLTREGEAVFRRAAPVHLRGIERYFASQLSDDEAHVVKRSLGRMAAALAAEPDPEPDPEAELSDPSDP